MKTNDFKVVYHIAIKEEFILLCNSTSYLPDNLHSDEFIHCTSEPETTLLVLGDYFKQEKKELLLIQISIKKLNSPIKFENPAPLSGGGTNHVKEGLLFPHIYGALNLDSIIGAAIIEKKDEAFVWPDQFLPLDEVIKNQTKK